MEKYGYFDGEALYAALDATRVARQLSWRQVARQSGVSSSTLTRMAQGRRPDADGLAALTLWAGLSADNFLRSDYKRRETEPIAAISTHLRADQNLTREGAIALEAVIKAAYRDLTASEETNDT